MSDKNNISNEFIKLLPLWQKDIIQAIESAIINKKRFMVVYIPTGLGRTDTIASLLSLILESKYSKRVLILGYFKVLEVQMLNILSNYIADDGIDFIKKYHVYSGNFKKEYLEKAEAFVYLSTAHNFQKKLLNNENNFKLPSDAFDTIIMDDYSDHTILKELEYFKAIKIGFTSYINPEDRINLRNNLISKISYEQAVYKSFLVDYNGKINFPYITKQLGGLAHISHNEDIKTAKIAINRTNHEIIWLDEPEKIKKQDNIFISTDCSVNPYYLFLFLGSTFGRKSLNRIFREAYIPPENEKNLYSIPVVLPELIIQKHIINQVLNIKEITTDLKTIAEEGENSIKNNLFNLGSFQEKLEKFSKYAKDTVYKSLPYPIAVAYRKFSNAHNNTLKFSHMIELFESVLRFIVLVNLKDYLCKLNPNEDIQKDIPLIKKLARPSLGDWEQIFNSLAKIKTTPGSELFIKEVKKFDLDKYRFVLKEFVEIRNDSLRGHGGVLSEEEYESKVQEYFPKLEELISNLGFLSKYNLVRTVSLDNEGEFFKISVDNLMGGVTPFEFKEIVTMKHPNNNKVVYFNSDLDFLDLDPFIIHELCPVCKKPEVLLLDKFSDKTITYFGPETGHRPTIANADRLPFAIKQFAK